MILGWRWSPPSLVRLGQNRLDNIMISIRQMILPKDPIEGAARNYFARRKSIEIDGVYFFTLSVIFVYFLVPAQP